MNVGYTRLSRDDDRRNYSSIETQKLIIAQAAAQMGIPLHRFYEDDGFSGYKFNRPGFQDMLETLEGDNHVIFVKDLSRLGRNNGKVLSLLDEFRERGIRLIAVDDNYDTASPEDDIVGIRTWYNERYVKDASRKIRRSLSARQKEGTLPVQVPFGYIRDHTDRQTLHIVREEASLIRHIFDLYIRGYGYRKISVYLTQNHMPTPSLLRHNTALKEGKVLKHPIAGKWSDAMVKTILANDFYTGTYRLHKRERVSIHGNDRRVPESDQYIWKNHHQPIIEPSTFQLVQELKEKRNRMNYRGSHARISPFGSCLFCSDCGGKLTPITRKSRTKIRKYYICSTYNTKGRSFCPKSHLIAEQDLLQDILACIRLCRDAFSDKIAAYTLKDTVPPTTLQQAQNHLKTLIKKEKESLCVLLSQKIKDMTVNSYDTNVISESYQKLQQNILARISQYEKELEQLNASETNTKNEKKKAKNALDVLDALIACGNLDRQDIEILVDRIVIDEKGFPEITLKYNLSELIPQSPARILNSEKI